jgi:hypothetical protein
MYGLDYDIAKKLQNLAYLIYASDHYSTIIRSQLLSSAGSVAAKQETGDVVRRNFYRNVSPILRFNPFSNIRIRILRKDFIAVRALFSFY